MTAPWKHSQLAKLPSESHRYCVKPADISACVSLALLGPLILSACQNPEVAQVSYDSVAPSEARKVPAQIEFATHIKPILQEKCVMCHNDTVLPGRPGFESAAHASRPGPYGPAIVPGRPDQSRLVQVLRVSESSEETMPPAGHRVTAQELALIEAWISQGGTWPQGSAGRIPYNPVPFDDRERGLIHYGQP